MAGWAVNRAVADVTQGGDAESVGKRECAMRRMLPLLGLVGLLALAWAMGWHEALSWAGLAARRAALAELVAARPVAAAPLESE